MKVKFFLATIFILLLSGLEIGLRAQTCPGTGSINYQKWNNISGTSISTLTSNSKYPNNPSSTSTLTSFEISSNSGSNFGVRVYGYLCPPTSGNYVFWIASDDNGELWLSNNASPSGRQRIAYHTGYTSSRQWTKYSTQKSAAISLVAGQVYYIDALMKEGSGSDNLAVGWSKPGQSTNSPSQVIPGSNLMTQYNPAPDTQAPTAPTNLVVSNLTETSLDLSWNASTDNVSVSGYDVFKNGIKINSTQVTSTSYPVNGLTSGTNYAFYIKANDAAGNSSGNSNTVNPTTLAPVTCPGTGTITYQQWNNIAGTTIANLTSSANFPNNPSSAGTLSKFETVTNTADNYGIKVCGYLCPPLTGSYTFWIASDDNGELWLSTTSSASNKIRIAYHTAWTNSQEWSKYSTQKSVAINMIAGQQYYIEALMKEGGGGDNLAVSWSKPGESTNLPSEVIPGNRLLPVLPVLDTESPSAPANLAVSNLAQSSLTLSWTASSDNVGVAGYDVYQNGSKINGATIVGTNYNVSGLFAATNYAFYVLAKDATGNTANSNILNVTTPDTQAPSAPANLAVSNLSQTSLTLSWTASNDNVGVIGYDVYQDGIKINASNIAGTNFNVTGLNAATAYSYYVIAKDAANNNSVASATLNVTTLSATNSNEIFTQRTVIAGQNMPHDLVYGPDNNLWYIERFAGKVNFVNITSGIKTTLLTLGSTMVQVGGQDGLFGLALHPQLLLGKPYVYIAYTYQSISSTVRKTRIARYTYNSSNHTLGSPVTVIEDLPGSNDHNAGRLAIGPDLKLYYSIGDMGAGQFDNTNRTQNAQNINVYEGKILRLNTEQNAGSWIPTDNPFGNAVFTLGHRNPQGLVWGNVNGNDILYSDEHGPYSDDEVNLIVSGRNYGWPQVAGLCDGNYNGRTLGTFNIISEQTNCANLNVKEPLKSLFPVSNPPSGGDNLTWPSTAPSGADFYGSNAIPGWQNSLLIAQLKKGALLRYKLSNDGQSIISDTIHYFQGKGRFRDVVVSPDGLKIYLACDASGSTSGPTGGVTTNPPNPGSILEFTYAPASGLASSNRLSEFNKKYSIKDNSTDIYPNPASDYIVIYNYNEVTDRTIEIFNLYGQVMKREKAVSTATLIQTQGMQNGFYILKVSDSKGKLIRSERILIQR